MLQPRQAKMLLDSLPRARSLLVCGDTQCCPRGVTDMIENRAHHFLYQRIQEVLGLSRIPEQLRPQRFLDLHLRPTTDRALAAANINWDDDPMRKKTHDHRKRLDALRIALGDQALHSPPKSFALVPKRRAAREDRT